MGSILTEKVCPQCKNESAQEDYYYKSGESIFFCPLCGYLQQHVYQREENDNWLMKTDVYEVDGKTIGYSALKEINGQPDLSDFTPFQTDITQEELDEYDKKFRLIQLDETEEYGFHYLSFWFNKRIVRGENGRNYFHHTHPIVVDSIEKGQGTCRLGDKKGAAIYRLEDIGLNAALEEAEKPELKNYSYITICRGDNVELVFGSADYNGHPMEKSKILEEPAYALDDLKEAYYLLHAAQYAMDTLCSDLYGSEVIPQETQEAWKEQAAQGMGQVYDTNLKALHESRGKELDSVSKLCRFAVSLAYEMTTFFPQDLLEKLNEMRKSNDYCFYRSYGKFWNEVPLPEIVEILFEQFCRLAGCEPQGQYAVSIYDLSDAAAVFASEEQVEQLMGSYDLEPCEKMSLIDGAWRC